MTITPASSQPRQRQRALDVSQPEATIEVHRAAYGIEHRSEEKILVPVFTGPTAEIEVEGSRTVNLGDYNSARVSVKVRLPCYPEETEIRRAYTIASGMVDRFMEREISIATGAGTNG